MLSAAPMLMTMNGNVKIAIANTTDGRLYRSGSARDAERLQSGVAGPPGSNTKRIPNAMYRAPNIGNTMNARTRSR